MRSKLTGEPRQEFRYQGERTISSETNQPGHGGVLVVARLGDHVHELDPRLDLAPGLAMTFDWGPAGRTPAAVRLALAILAHALAHLPEGDELALRYCREFEREAVRHFADGWFDHGAWATTRWIAELRDERDGPRVLPTLRRTAG